MSVVGCGTPEGEAPAQVAVSTAKQALSTQLEIALGFPAGFSQSNVAIHASQSLRIAGGATLQDANGAPAAAVNIGTGLLEVNAGTRTGSLIGGGDVWLGSQSQATGTVQAAGAITKQAGADIIGTELSATPLGPLESLRFTVEFPSTVSVPPVGPDTTASLAPGAYTSVAVGARSTLDLSSGTYYLDQLQMQPQSIARLDTSAGPVIVYVRELLDFKGGVQIVGPDSSFFLAYLGTGTVSIESAFNGTLVAPSATLRLAPVGSPGHRGAFFGQTVDAAEAGSTITFDPFDHWYDVLNIHPVVKCVRRFKHPAGAALFGYENESDFPVTVPLGPANQLVPAGDVAPPTTLLPGAHDNVFFAPFDLSGSLKWQLAGETATASSSSPACDLGDVPPEREPTPSPAVVPIERASVSLSSVSAQLAPEVTTSATSHLASEVYGDFVGPQVGNTSNEEAGPAAFTFTVTSLNFDDSEGLCGTVDPFVAKLVIDGQDKGQASSGTVQVARDRTTVHVSVDVDDDDAWFCLGDEDLQDYEFDVDLYSGATAANETCIDGGRMCFTATPIASPDICFDWNAQFIDSGPWTGVGSEDFLAGKAVQPVPASFARYQITMTNSTGVLFDRGGVLDRNGCVPRPKLPVRSHWQLGTDLQIATRVISQHCLDPAGTNCAMNGSELTGANVVVRQTGQSGPASMCAIYAENLGSVTDATCSARQIDWPAMPPAPLRPVFTEHNSITRTSAAISQMLQREDASGGELGIVRAMIDHRYEGDGRVQIVVDEFCLTSDPCTGEQLQTSCRSQNSLILEPDGLVASTTRFKYIVAHEFGHFIQGNGQGLMRQNYGCGAGDPSQPALCRCDGVPPDQRLHCLQSMEEPNAAQIEGFAQYFAAKAFNADMESDCTFVYYKPISSTACMPGVTDCALDPDTELYVNQPPIPVSCKQAVRWRNTHCIDESSSADLLSFGTEYDWLEFLYRIDNHPISAERWRMKDIFNAYIAACSESAENIQACTDKRVSWDGGLDHESLLDGVALLVTEGFKTPEAAENFENLGDEFGVSDVP
ncbi:hypothetical protein WMF31_13115 [Sorangium sp. So ce1036]|uniref:hypothetical protein n=1 Tax=Sorangium sp. So ce1036 TaxID=3133328 RepID=UPI003F0E849E